MFLASVRQSPCPALTVGRDGHNVLGAGAAAEKRPSASDAKQACAVVVIRAAWVRQAASLPSFANCDVIRKEKGENGLFLSKSFASFRAEDKQIGNDHGNQNK